MNTQANHPVEEMKTLLDLCNQDDYATGHKEEIVASSSYKMRGTDP